MAWLFGKKKEVQKKPNAEEALKKIIEQIELSETREKILVTKMRGYQEEALRFNKLKNKRSAILALKKKKMVEGQCNKQAGMRLMLEQQKIQLEAAMSDVDILAAMNQGNQAMKEINKQANIEDFDVIREELDGRQADAKEIEDYFVGLTEEGMDDLETELNELIAEEAGEIKLPSVPSHPIGSSIKQPTTCSANSIAVDDDSKLLSSLMA